MPPLVSCQNSVGAKRVTSKVSFLLRPLLGLFVKRAGLFLPLAFALAACQLSLPGSGPTTIALFDGSLTVAAPSGYCIDPQTATQTGESAVVLIGRCRATSKATAALVTVTVGVPGSAAVMAAGGETLAAFFTSADGRATLSRSGNPSDVTVNRAVMAGEDFLMLLSDQTVGTYWRAITGMRGRVLTVSAGGTVEVPLTPEASREILDATLAALHAANLAS